MRLNISHSTTTLLLSLFLFLFIAPTPNTMAASVEFRGGAENIVFNTDGSALTDTDLFSGLKNAKPGDALTQNIDIINSASDYSKVRIFLRAVPHDEEENPLSPEVSATENLASMEEFLSQLTMQAYLNGTLLSSDTADQTAGLTDNVFLGEFKKDEFATLQLKLAIPITLGNEYAHRKGEIDWVFTAEGDPLAAPNTGSNKLEALNSKPEVIIIIAVSTLGIIAYIVLQRHNRKKSS